MKKRNSLQYLSIIILFVLRGGFVYAQENGTYGKNAISFNLTKALVNELSMSYEHWINFRQSIEFNGGLIYANDFLSNQVDDWENATLFMEHGYAGRFYYKIHRRPEENKKWRDYIAFGISYKYLYYNDYYINNGEIKIDTFDAPVEIYSPPPQDTTITYTQASYTEKFLRDSQRHKLGLEFIWGKVYEMNKTFAFEFYFGGGLVANMASHTDHDRYATYRNKDFQHLNGPIPNYEYEQFYMRPVLLLGLKFRIRF
jgi:hypothetical protein